MLWRENEEARMGASEQRRMYTVSGRGRSIRERRAAAGSIDGVGPIKQNSQTWAAGDGGPLSPSKELSVCLHILSKERVLLALV